MDQPFFHLSFRPNIKLVTTVREFTVNFYHRMISNADLSSRIALATHELLENAVTYAVDNETTVRVEIANEHLVIKTWNRGSNESVATLRALIDEMNESEDADEYYQTLMVRTAMRTDGSGLGLARIRAEADMCITYEIEQDRVCIRASTPLVGGVSA